MAKKVEKLTAATIQHYEQLRKIRSDFLSTRYRSGIRSHPKNRLFNFSDPYDELDKVTKDSIKTFEKIIKLMLDVNINGSTIRIELDKMKMMLTLQDKSDAVIDRLLKM